MDGAGKLVRDGLVDHPVTLDPAFSRERRGDDADAKMGFAFRPVPGVAGMQMRLVTHSEAFRSEGLAQPIFDTGLDRHDAATFL